MKKKIVKILFLLLVVMSLVGCQEKEEEKEMKEESKTQVKEIIEQNEDGTIKKGILEGYKFTETKEQTDRVKLEMENGDIMLIVLSNSDAPITIANFKKLVNEKFYDGLTFHRVMSGFMIQGGDPNGDGTGGSDEEITGEFALNGVTNNMKHTKGVISMARAKNPNSASSQFFIMHDTASSLDGSYAAFGRVFAGLEIVDKIASVKVEDNGYGEKSRPVKSQVIKTIRFIAIEKEN